MLLVIAPFPAPSPPPPPRKPHYGALRTKIDMRLTLNSLNMDSSNVLISRKSILERKDVVSHLPEKLKKQEVKSKIQKLLNILRTKKTFQMK